MKRYIITKALKKAVKESKYTQREMNSLLNFEIRNVLNKNLSIDETLLKKISKLLQRGFRLKPISLNVSKKSV